MLFSRSLPEIEGGLPLMRETAASPGEHRPHRPGEGPCGPGSGLCSLGHLGRRVEIGSPAAIGELGERFDGQLLALQVADEDNLREAEFVLSAERYRRRGADIRGIRHAWRRTPIARSRTAGSKGIDRDGAARDSDNYLDKVIGRRINVFPGS